MKTKTELFSRIVELEEKANEENRELTDAEYEEACRLTDEFYDITNEN